MIRRATGLAVASLAALLAACGSAPQRAIEPVPAPSAQGAKRPKADSDLPKMPAAGSGRGGYYKDDGPGDNPPPNLRDVPDAQVKAEPYARYANRSYVVFGKTYTPMANDRPFRQRGVSSWYGKKFHGQRTSSGELYDMYKMTAAHPTLPIPSYARVTSRDSGRSVVVRINDRGPFHASRVIDVSYTAALKLGLLGKGSHEVEVERLLPNAPEMTATTLRSVPQAETFAVASAALSEPGAPMSQDGPPAQEAATPAPGFYLQLGAYARAEKAAQVRASLIERGGTAVTLEVVGAGALHRLFSGPFESRTLARQAARALPAALRLKPIVIKR